ncbi:MAG: hypothetical protein ACM3PS_04805 [Syntrophothermus sp.]
MYNDRLSSEEAQERIQERLKEAESYSLNKQPEYDHYTPARWIFVLVILMIAVAYWLLF